MLDNNFDYSLNQLNNVALAIFNDLSSYQDHKERMANGGFLFEAALLSGYLAKYKELETILSSQALVIMAFSALWLVAHLFIRWQMRAKEEASLKQNGILISMSVWVHNKPTKEDFEADTRQFSMSTKFKIYDFIDMFYPMPHDKPSGYLSKRKYPKALVDGILEIYKQEPKPPLTDYLYFHASLLVLIIGILFTVFN